MVPLNFSNIICLLVIVGSVRSQDDYSQVEYVGCFSTQYAQDRDLGRSFYPFSWESCILLCQSKGSRYAGMVNRLRQCYCGSYLAENSKPSHPSECSYSCKGVRRKSCGGEKKMTIYKLTDDISPRILVTTEKMITYVKDTQLIPLIMITSGSIGSRIRFHYKYNEIYFNINSDIARSQYSTARHSFDPPSIIISSVGEDKPFVVDWVSDKIYYLKGDNIWGANLNGTDQRVLLATTESKVYRMEINPYENKLVYNFENSLKEYDIINKMENLLVDSGSLDFIPMALDVHTEAIYAMKSSQNIIMKRLPGSSEFVLAVRAVNWAYIYNLAVADYDCMFFTHQSGTTLLLQGRNGFLTITVPEDRKAGVVVMSEVIQAPTKKVACLRMRCSHNCQYSPESFARCVCPSDMQLDSTGRRCKTVRSHRSSTEESSSGDSSASDERKHSRRHSRRRHSRRRHSPALYQVMKEIMNTTLGVNTEKTKTTPNAK